MENKGQLSMEVLIITVAIFALSISVLGYYFAEQDTTTAMAIAKSETLAFLSEQDGFYYIKGITYSRTTDTIALTIDIEPTLVAMPTGFPGGISDKIKANTNFTTVSVTFP